MLEYQVIEPVGEHRGTVIWFHGMGQGPDAFAALLAELDLAAQGIRSVLPYAPEQRRSMSGQLVPIWFNRLHDDLFKVDPVSLRRAIDGAQALIRQEARLIDASNITLCGFSQGGAVALCAGLRYEQRLRGIAAFAPTAIDKADIDAPRHADGAATPCWIGHGADDDVLLAAESQALADWLATQGYPVSFHLCACAHVPFDGMDASARASLRALMEG